MEYLQEISDVYALAVECFARKHSTNLHHLEVASILPLKAVSVIFSLLGEHVPADDALVLSCYIVCGPPVKNWEIAEEVRRASNDDLPDRAYAMRDAVFEWHLNSMNQLVENNDIDSVIYCREIFDSNCERLFGRYFDRERLKGLFPQSVL